MHPGYPTGSASLSSWLGAGRSKGGLADDSLKIRLLIECIFIQLDVLVGGDIPGGIQALSGAEYRRERLWEPPTSHFQVAFVQSQPSNVKDAIRVAKWWRSLQDWRRMKPPVSYLMELLVIAAHDHLTKKSASAISVESIFTESELCLVSNGVRSFLCVCAGSCGCAHAASSVLRGTTTTPMTS